MEENRLRLGQLCWKLSRSPSLEAIIRGGDGGIYLDELRALIQTADQRTREKRIPALLDEIEEVCKRCGLAGIMRGGVLPRGFSLPALPCGWVCPRGVCDRVVLPEEEARLRSCSATGTSMAEFRLPA
jgi:hypothetical protein